MSWITANQVSVEYSVHEFKFHTFKEYIFQQLRGQGGAKKFKALNDVSLQIQPGEAVALIGHNGSGKSTLLKVIAGIITPSGGSVEARGRIAPMIELGTGFDPELSGRENIMLSCTIMGLSTSEINAIQEEIIAFSELRDFIDLPLKNYSSGMYARLGFACATAIKPDILIVDEVLAVGDSNFARKCLERISGLKQSGTTFILVSHDSNTVRSFCDRGVVLETGSIQFDGPVHEALKVQEEIMDRRYLANLPDEQRAEILRLRELEQNEAARNMENRPSVACRFWVESNGQPTNTVKGAASFAIAAEIKVNECIKLVGKLNVGFALVTPGGQRVTGMNLGQKLSAIDPARIQEGRPFRIRFDFADGIPTLASGQYFLVISVMDSENARHLVHMDPVAVQFVSDADRNNFDGDVLSLQQLTVQAHVVPVE